MSLYTDHLASMYGPRNHTFYDPNVFYQDDGLRKQVDQFAGGMIFTGQEKPSGGRGRVREDLLTKFATADGIAGRMPCAILTNKFRIVGWKRDGDEQHVMFRRRR